MSEAPMIQAMVWYREEDWNRLMEIFVDRHLIPQTFKEWEEKALENVEKAKLAGDTPVKVYIDPEPFLGWCKNKKVSPDADARTTFALEVVTLQQFGEKV
ncbi:MAG: hypothetical protein OEM02_00810 [Desulfobulbaceae bacterium]|nr:hypothetical protein [Desulfobulbaceae bacterium]